MRFALLGTLMLDGGAGDPVVVPGARQRALLASLLLSANAPVSCDALAEAVWDGSPPPGATVTLRSHVRRLRQALGPRTGSTFQLWRIKARLCVVVDELNVGGRVRRFDGPNCDSAQGRDAGLRSCDGSDRARGDASRGIGRRRGQAGGQGRGCTRGGECEFCQDIHNLQVTRADIRASA